jgi:hypothetical protein
VVLVGVGAIGTGASAVQAVRGVAASAAESGAPETISVFRKMSTQEADLTLRTEQLQPPIKGTNGSKYLSESLDKVINQFPK